MLPMLPLPAHSCCLSFSESCGACVGLVDWSVTWQAQLFPFPTPSLATCARCRMFHRPSHNQQIPAKEVQRACCSHGFCWEDIREQLAFPPKPVPGPPLSWGNMFVCCLGNSPCAFRWTLRFLWGGTKKKASASPEDRLPPGSVWISAAKARIEACRFVDYYLLSAPQLAGRQRPSCNQWILPPF